ncbi:MAG: GxxExxY protein [Patescibacteria group bacterium]
MEYKHTEITEKIISAAFEVHNKLGAGFLERVYHSAMNIALKQKGLAFESEKEYKIFYDGHEIALHRLDLVVEDKVVVELKSMIGEMPNVYRAQVLSYMKVSNLEVGLLINFGNESLDIKRLTPYKRDYKMR